MKGVTAVKSARTNGRTGTPKVVQKVLADIEIPKSDIDQVLNYWKKAKMCLFEFIALLLLSGLIDLSFPSCSLDDRYFILVCRLLRANRIKLRSL